MAKELRVRRAAVGVAVLALHILILLALLTAIRTPMAEKTLPVREILIRLLPAPSNPGEEETKTPAEMPPPAFLVPDQPHAITPAPEISSQPATPPEGDIGALGRYLYNCSGAYYEKLSPREKAHCLGNQWDNKGPGVMLGTAKPSPFDAVIARRNAPFVPVQRPCPVDKPQANLGLPCFDFSGHSLTGR